jgi:predicted nucleic acid-binding protein
MKEKRADLAEARTNQFRYAVYLKKLLIDEEVAVKAGDFKGKYNIPIADAFIAATAYFEEATIISDDPDFEKIQEIKTLTEKQFVTRLLKE